MDARQEEIETFSAWVFVVIATVFFSLFKLMSEYEAAEKRGMKVTANLCEQIADCDDYPKLRSVCATAGSYEKCMEIKYGNRDTYLRAKLYCTNDGKLISDPENLPGFIQCAIAKFNGE